MISVILWSAFGAIVGAVSKRLLPSHRVQSGWLHTIGIGIAGSAIGGVVASVMFGGHYHPAGLVLSVAGAVLCLWLHAKYLEAE